MTVRRPKLPRAHPLYQSDFEEAAAPAFDSLVIVAASAGWTPETIAEGLLALARAQSLKVDGHVASEKKMLRYLPGQSEAEAAVLANGE